jgi:HemY protein
VLRPLLEERPTVRVCLAMAEIEQAEGATGRVREWLARATHAPRDKAWIADGIVSETWSPVSPVSGRLDAFVWDTPPEVIGAPNTRALLFEEPEPEPEPVAQLPVPSAASPPSGEAPTPTPAIEATPSAGLEPAAAPVAGPGPVAKDLPPESVPAEPAPEVKASEPTAPPSREQAASVPAEPAPRPEAPKRSGPTLVGGATPAPVVFPVSHPPDDPGADAEQEERPRRRFLG